VRLFVSLIYILIYFKIIIIFVVVKLRHVTLTGVDNDCGYPAPLAQLLLMCFRQRERIYCNPLYTIRHCGFKEHCQMLNTEPAT
jgi:hypothetical protein